MRTFTLMQNLKTGADHRQGPCL